MTDEIIVPDLDKLTGKELFEEIYRNLDAGLSIAKEIEDKVLNNGGWNIKDIPSEIWAGGSKSNMFKSLRFPKKQPFKNSEIAIDAVEYCLAVKVDNQWWKTVYNIKTRKTDSK